MDSDEYNIISPISCYVLCEIISITGYDVRNVVIIINVIQVLT